MALGGQVQVDHGGGERTVAEILRKLSIPFVSGIGALQEKESHQFFLRPSGIHYFLRIKPPLSLPPSVFILALQKDRSKITLLRRQTVC